MSFQSRKIGRGRNALREETQIDSCGYSMTRPHLLVELIGNLQKRRISHVLCFVFPQFLCFSLRLEFRSLLSRNSHARQGVWSMRRSRRCRRLETTTMSTTATSISQPSPGDTDLRPVEAEIGRRRCAKIRLAGQSEPRYQVS